MMRRRIPASATQGLIRTGQYIDPGTAELGWLTPLRQSAGGGGYHLFRCRCGAEVAFASRQIRKAVKEGRTPKCSRVCLGVKTEGAQAGG
jgi:hypothetical protein